MFVINTETNEALAVVVRPVTEEDYSDISQERYWFNWKEESEYDVFKLCDVELDEIFGLVSLETIEDESRIEIRLLAVSRENRGAAKMYERIAGNLIAFACIEAIKKFGEWACVSLVPKTELIDHYMNKYFMIKAGRSLFVDGKDLINLINAYDHG